MINPVSTSPGKCTPKYIRLNPTKNDQIKSREGSHLIFLKKKALKKVATAIALAAWAEK